MESIELKNVKAMAIALQDAPAWQKVPRAIELASRVLTWAEEIEKRVSELEAKLCQ